VCQTLMLGASAPLLSSFKLSYYTLLNITKRSSGGARRHIHRPTRQLSEPLPLCSPEKEMEAVIRKSFHQFQHDQKLPEARLIS